MAQTSTEQTESISDQNWLDMEALRESWANFIDLGSMTEAILNADDWSEQIISEIEPAGFQGVSVALSVREMIQSLGYHQTIITCIPTDAGAPNIITVQRHKHSHYRITSVTPYSSNEFIIKKDKIARHLGVSSDLSPLRSLIIERTRPFYPLESPPAPNHSPLTRLRGLLSLERESFKAIVLYAFTVGILSLATPLAVQSLVNTVAFGTLVQPLVVLILLLFAGLACAGFLRVLEIVVIEYWQRRLFARAAADTANRLPFVDHNFRQTNDLAEITNRFFDVAALQKVSASLLLDGVGLALQTIVGMIVLAFYHPFLLAFDILLIGALFVIFRFIGHGAINTAIFESKAKYKLVAWLQTLARCSHAYGPKSLKRALADADSLTSNYIKSREQHFSRILRQTISLVALQAIASALLLGIGGYLVMQGQLTLGQLVAAELIVTAVIGQVAKFGKHLESFYDAAASADKIGQLIDLPLRTSSGIKYLSDVTRLDCLDLKLARSKQSVPITFSILPGQSLALSGETGSGKTLLLKTLSGLVAPESGDIIVQQGDKNTRINGLVSPQIRYIERTVSKYDQPSKLGGEIEELMNDFGINLLDLYNKNSKDQINLTDSNALLLALAHQFLDSPLYLLLDGTLDTLSIQRTQNVLKTAKRNGIGLIISTHRPDIKELCNLNLHMATDNARRNP